MSVPQFCSDDIWSEISTQLGVEYVDIAAQWPENPLDLLDTDLENVKIRICILVLDLLSKFLDIFQYFLLSIGKYFSR
jgi:hypothetical protein